MARLLVENTAKSYFNYVKTPGGTLKPLPLATIVFKRNAAKKYRTFGSPGSPSALPEIPPEKEGDFRTLVIPGYTEVKDDKVLERPPIKLINPPRYASMPTDQDWTDVWPTAKTFQWSAVPLPIRQGLVRGLADNEGIPPGKYGNAELMKIPNFLHLTPNHVKKHCKALRGTLTKTFMNEFDFEHICKYTNMFCTQWPKKLKSDESIENNFPVEVVRRSYVADGASNKDLRSRLVTLQLKMSTLELDYHARDKLKRLLGDRYNVKTDMITLSADRCPLKKQNYDFLHYALTAVYFEACKLEDWEVKEVEDMEYYDWDKHRSRKNIVETIKRGIELKGETQSNLPTVVKAFDEEADEEKIVKHESVKNLRVALELLFNKGESRKTIENYKHAVENILFPYTPNLIVKAKATLTEKVAALDEDKTVQRRTAREKKMAALKNNIKAMLQEKTLEKKMAELDVDDMAQGATCEEKVAAPEKQMELPNRFELYGKAEEEGAAQKPAKFEEMVAELEKEKEELNSLELYGKAEEEGAAQKSAKLEEIVVELEKEKEELNSLELFGKAEEEGAARKKRMEEAPTSLQEGKNLSKLDKRMAKEKLILARLNRLEQKQQRKTKIDILTGKLAALKKERDALKKQMAALKDNDSTEKEDSDTPEKTASVNQGSTDTRNIDNKSLKWTAPKTMEALEKQIAKLEKKKTELHRLEVKEKATKKIMALIKKQAALRENIEATKNKAFIEENGSGTPEKTSSINEGSTETRNISNVLKKWTALRKEIAEIKKWRAKLLTKMEKEYSKRQGWRVRKNMEALKNREKRE